MAATKGYDDSPPRNGIIFFYTVLTVFMLVGVKFLLDSYFANMMGAEVHEKVLSRGMAEVAAVRAKEADQLKGGSLPIDQAIRLIGQRGRGASALIAPQSGAGAAEISGWSQLKRAGAQAAPAPATNEAAAPAAPEAPAPGPTH
jgi:hypothetical protein